MRETINSVIKARHAGLLTGTPTVNGQLSFSVRAPEPSGCLGERAYTLTLNPPCTTVTLTPAILPGDFAGTAYSQTVNASGGATPYTFRLSAGSLP